MKKNYTCIKDDNFNYKQLNSKFYSFIYSVSSYDEIKKHLNILKLKYSDCSHICYAYRLFSGFSLLNDISTNDFSTDSGEPRGSSGPPILKILKRHNMINVVIFVIRYFGGTKLGISGLTKAYSESAEGLITKNNLKLWFPTEIVELEYPYHIEKSLNNIFKRFNIIINKQDYNDLIYSVIEVNIEDVKSFINTLSSIPGCSIKKA